MQIVKEDDITLTKNTFRLLISGVTGSGKTTFVNNFLNIHHKKFHNLFCYAENEDFKQFNVKFMPTSFNPLEDYLEGNSLVIFDDAIFNKTLVKIASELFIRGRHKKISVIFITQNLFHQSTGFRALSLNASHVFIFAIRDLKQISYFAKSFLPDDEVKEFLKLYKKQVLEKPFHYLLIDFSQPCHSILRIRSNVLLEFEKYQSVHVL